VFWASLAVVLVTWGLVPTQAGIFTVRSVTRTANMAFAVSTSSMPFEEQAMGLTMRYAQSGKLPLPMSCTLRCDTNFVAVSFPGASV